MTQFPDSSPADIDSVAALIDLLGGPSAVGRFLGKRDSTIGEMKRSGSINSIYWVELVEWAQGQGHRHVTYEMLAKLHARKIPNLELTEASA